MKFTIWQWFPLHMQLYLRTNTNKLTGISCTFCRNNFVYHFLPQSHKTFLIFVDPSIKFLCTFFYSKRRKQQKKKQQIEQQKSFGRKKKSTIIWLCGRYQHKYFYFRTHSQSNICALFRSSVFLCSIYCTAETVFHINFSFIRNSQK